jgi:hypothetical protein
MVYPHIAFIYRRPGTGLAVDVTMSVFYVGYLTSSSPLTNPVPLAVMPSPTVCNNARMGLDDLWRQR